MHTYPAHETVIASDANSCESEWPVSGDESHRAHGYVGLRKARNAVDLWSMPGVKPKRATQGIRVGDTIESWGGEGVVTRVGSIAGWYLVDGIETRWEAREVSAIYPA